MTTAAGFFVGAMMFAVLYYFLTERWPWQW